MTYELRQRELAVEANVALPVIYKGFAWTPDTGSIWWLKAPSSSS
jgi:hypothetical protein